MQKPLLLLAKDTTREKIENDEIVYITIVDKYVRIKLKDKRSFRIRTSLQQFEKRLPPDLFFRIHKKYIVCLRHIRFVDTHVTMITGDQIPISRELKESFLNNFDFF